MKDPFLALWGLIEQLGFTWTYQDGTNITVELELTWEAYVKVVSSWATALPSAWGSGLDGFGHWLQLMHCACLLLKSKV